MNTTISLDTFTSSEHVLWAENVRDLHALCLQAIDQPQKIDPALAKAKIEISPSGEMRIVYYRNGDLAEIPSVMLTRQNFRELLREIVEERAERDLPIKLKQKYPDLA